MMQLCNFANNEEAAPQVSLFPSATQRWQNNDFPISSLTCEITRWRAGSEELLREMVLSKGLIFFCKAENVSLDRSRDAGNLNPVRYWRVKKKLTRCFTMPFLSEAKIPT
ncbi:MAG: hypothetical protein J7K89_00845 [Candidatus Cloacimonetes bacterium]|nr:hypothetical protein [Candidatus Cloacimonadota bacterium]